MALSLSSSIAPCPRSSQFSPRDFFLKNNLVAFPKISSSVLRLRYRIVQVNRRTVVCAASSAAGTPSSDGDFNPYEVLGVSAIEGFDKIKTVYNRKRKDAERKGDEATASQLEKAYDKIMLAQLSNRKKGITFGSFQVSKEIKYADKEPIVPWGPRRSKSDMKDVRINLAISVAFAAWILIKQTAEYLPLQFMVFAFVYRIFEKLRASEKTVSPTFTEDGEDDGRTMRMGKRLLRSLGLVFGCVAISALGYTCVLNILEFTRGYVPVFLYDNQEMFVTVSSAVMLFIVGSYYR